MNQPKFRAIIKDTGEEIDVIGLEFNNDGVTWVTLLRGVPRRNNTYIEKTTRRVPISWVTLKQIRGRIDDETTTK